MFRGFGQTVTLPTLNWGQIGSQLVTTGTSYLTTQSQAKLVQAQADLAAAQQKALTAQAGLVQAQTAGVGFDMGKMMPYVIVGGIGLLAFMGRRRRR